MCAEGIRQFMGRDEIQLGCREIQKMDRRDSQDRVGGIQFLAQRLDLVLGIQIRRAAGDHHHVHPVAAGCVAEDCAAAAEDFIIRMGRNHKYVHGFFRERDFSSSDMRASSAFTRL